MGSREEPSNYLDYKYGHDSNKSASLHSTLSGRAVEYQVFKRNGVYIDNARKPILDRICPMSKVIGQW